MVPHRILIADDDDLACELIASAIRAEGHEATVVANGEQALERLRTHPTDLLILDANMPVMDGYALLEAMRSEPPPNAPPVLMLTALRDERDVIRARQLGATSYMVKPFLVRKLLERVESLIAPPPPESCPITPDRVETPAARTDVQEWID